MKQRLIIDGQLDINATLATGAPDSSVVYSVPADQQSIITVDSAGIVTAHALGTAGVDIKKPTGELIAHVMIDVLTQTEYNLQTGLDAGTHQISISIDGHAGLAPVVPVIQPAPAPQPGQPAPPSFHDDGSSLVGWTPVTGPAYQGTLATSGSALYVSDFGTLNSGDLKGPSAIKDMGLTFGDFVAEFALNLSNADSLLAAGGFNIWLMSQDGSRRVFRFRWAPSGSNTVQATAQVDADLGNGATVYTSGLLPAYATVTAVKIQRAGNQWSLYVNGAKVGNTISGETTPVRFVQLVFAKQASKSAPTMQVDDIHVQ